MFSLTIALDKEKDFVNIESVQYPITALIADIGGATGLFLGVSVIVTGSHIAKLTSTHLTPRIQDGKYLKHKCIST